MKPNKPMWARVMLAAVVLLLILVAHSGWSAERQPYGQGLLWRVEMPSAAPNYVFGTMHSTDASVAVIPTPVEQALSQTGIVMVEVVLTADIGIKLAQAMMIMDGRNLVDIIGADRFARVVAVGGRYGLPDLQMNRFRPWALMTLFSVPPAETARQAAGYAALDLMIQSKAREHGTTLVSLETVEEQIALFANLPEPDEIALLDGALNLNPDIEAIFEHMKAAYLAGDLDSLQRLAKERTGGVDPSLFEQFMTRAIDSRNQLMVDRMGDQLSAGNTFVAVGALHLPGEKGILRLLELKGYRITRVY
jgi:uncharacterized protein YbaP (TraB family)